jgi:CRISPR-associated protein Cmr4
MSYQHALVIYETITPLHVGCGQDVGVVDLPVIRERTTGYPFIPGSGIRGSLREAFSRREKADVDLLFGPEAGKDEEVRYAGCVATHDAKILLFPVRSDRGIFLWITCPAVLARFSRDAEVFLPQAAAWRTVPGLAPGDEEVLGPAELAPATRATPIYLEEYAFGWADGGGPELAAGRQGFATWIGRLAKAAGVPGLAERTVLVSDRTFHHFVSHATVVQQHNRLTSAKTVEGGALFAVEAVPPQALFYGFLGGTTSRRPEAEGKQPLGANQVLESLNAFWGARGGAAYLHLGGDEGTGFGVTRLVWAADERQAGAGSAGGGAAGLTEDGGAR